MKPGHVGRNDPCPCGSGKKFKQCCLGKVDWEQFHGRPIAEAASHMTLRGKNLSFMASVFAALKIDKPDTPFKELKRAFTPEAVGKIHDAVAENWPTLQDYQRAIQADGARVTALYTGSYEPADVFRAVARHSLYSDKIYLVDPFLNPALVRREFSPLVHPDQYRSTTIKFTFLWASLWPWIDAGIVNFVRPISDFIPGAQQEIYRMQETRFQEHPELKALVEEYAKGYANAAGASDSGFGEHLFLAHPDDFFRELYREKSKEGENPFASEDELLSYINLRRQNHPYYVDRLPGQTAEIHVQTTGSSYELAKRICKVSRSHIITTLPSRWKEVEIDRQHAGIDDQGWSSFAKALQNSDLTVLSDIPLAAALRLRDENRLEGMQLFFRKLWAGCSEPDRFSESNGLALSAELNQRIAESRSEWQKIDHDLVKWLGVTAGSLLATGLVGFVPAAAAGVVSGAVSLAHAKMKRNDVKDLYPAAFFLGLKNKKDGGP